MKAFGKEVKEQNKRDRGHNVDIRRIVRLSWGKSNVLSLSIKEGQWRRKRTGEARMKLAIYKMSEETGWIISRGRKGRGWERPGTNKRASETRRSKVYGLWSMVYGRGRQTARDNHWSPDSQTIKAFVQSRTAFLSIHTCSKVLWTMPKLASPAHSPGSILKYLSIFLTSRET